MITQKFNDILTDSSRNGNRIAGYVEMFKIFLAAGETERKEYIDIMDKNLAILLAEDPSIQSFDAIVEVLNPATIIQENLPSERQLELKQAILNLWGYVFLIFKNKIHKTVYLNKYLSVVESFFNSDFATVRSVGFFSWKYLIFNFMFNHHLLNVKRLNMLLIPLWNCLKFEEGETALKNCADCIGFLACAISYCLSPNNSIFDCDLESVSLLVRNKMKTKSNSNLDLFETFLYPLLKILGEPKYQSVFGKQEIPRKLTQREVSLRTLGVSLYNLLLACMIPNPTFISHEVREEQVANPKPASFFGLECRRLNVNISPIVSPNLDQYLKVLQQIPQDLFFSGFSGQYFKAIVEMNYSAALTYLEKNLNCVFLNEHVKMLIQVEPSKDCSKELTGLVQFVTEKDVAMALRDYVNIHRPTPAVHRHVFEQVLEKQGDSARKHKLEAKTNKQTDPVLKKQKTEYVLVPTRKPAATVNNNHKETQENMHVFYNTIVDTSKPANENRENIENGVSDSKNLFDSTKTSNTILTPTKSNQKINETTKRIATLKNSVTSKYFEPIIVLESSQSTQKPLKSYEMPTSVDMGLDDYIIPSSQNDNGKNNLLMDNMTLYELFGYQKELMSLLTHCQEAIKRKSINK